MTRLAWCAVAVLAVAACEAPSEPAAAIALWEPVDASFAGCRGACGAHAEGPSEDVAAQPGVAIGARTYCPVSGAVFEVAEEHPRVEVAGQPLFFCCASCADYFRAHREEVLRARGIELAPRARAER